MASGQESTSPELERQLELEERGRRIVATVMANRAFMAGVREGLESERRSDMVHVRDLKRKYA